MFLESPCEGHPDKSTLSDKVCRRRPSRRLICHLRLRFLVADPPHPPSPKVYLGWLAAYFCCCHHVEISSSRTETQFELAKDESHWLPGLILTLFPSWACICAVLVLGHGDSAAAAAAALCMCVSAWPDLNASASHRPTGDLNERVCACVLGRGKELLYQRIAPEPDGVFFKPPPPPAQPLATQGFHESCDVGS